MVFRLAHLSDNHLGDKLGRKVNGEGVNIRTQDGYDAFKNIVDDVIAHQVDAVVIAGDTMHVPNPDIRSLIEAQTQLRRFAEVNIPVYMLAGNHETTDIRADVASSKIFDDPLRNLHSYAEPYVKVEIADGLWLHIISHHMYRDQAEMMSRVKSVDGAINILTTHGSVIDPILQMALHEEMSPREIVIPDFLLEEQSWDYILLGHIHERGWVGSTDKLTDTSNSRIYYNGSSFRRGFSDKEAPLGKGWTLWTIEPNGNITPEIFQVHQRTQLDFKPIDAKNISSAEITERVIQNLRSSQTNGTEFIEATAPILRQQIINLTPAKKLSLDWESIGEETGHALTYKTKESMDGTVDDSGSTVDSGSFNSGADVVHAYDKWANSSTTLSKVPESEREEPKKKARLYVRQAQSQELESE